jgi:hypothetical protein
MTRPCVAGVPWLRGSQDKQGPGDSSERSELWIVDLRFGTRKVSNRAYLLGSSSENIINRINV